MIYTLLADVRQWRGGVFAASVPTLGESEIICSEIHISPVQCYVIISSYYSIIYVDNFIKLYIDIYVCVCIWFIYISSFFSHYFDGQRVPFSWTFCRLDYWNSTKEISMPFCGRTFSRNCNILLHSKSHTDAKPYQCNICDSAFSRKCDLLRQ